MPSKQYVTCTAAGSPAHRPAVGDSVTQRTGPRPCSSVTQSRLPYLSFSICKAGTAMCPTYPRGTGDKREVLSLREPGEGGAPSPCPSVGLTHLLDPVQQGLEPVPVHLTVAVQESQGAALGNVSAPDPGPDQTCRGDPLSLHLPASAQRSHTASPTPPPHNNPPLTAPGPAQLQDPPCRWLLRKHFTLGSLMSSLQSPAAKTKVYVKWAPGANGGEPEEQVRQPCPASPPRADSGVLVTFGWGRLTMAINTQRGPAHAKWLFGAGPSHSGTC